MLISSKIIAQAIVILGLATAGYDFLHGEMPSNDVMMLIKHYGVSINLVITILYCKFIEKRNLESMGIVKRKLQSRIFRNRNSSNTTLYYICFKHIKWSCCILWEK
ncbi:hypothetical protein JTS99_04610 [Clostridium botulinum]|nr:hypothetical protein [Clostridium botulinum]